MHMVDKPVRSRCRQFVHRIRAMYGSRVALIAIAALNQREVSHCLRLASVTHAIGTSDPISSRS